MGMSVDEQGFPKILDHPTYPVILTNGKVEELISHYTNLNRMF